MQIKVYEGIPNDLDDKIMKILIDIDKEFLPALSQRESSTSMSLNSNNSHTNGLYDYLEALKGQTNYIMFDEDNIMGFASIKKNYSTDFLKVKACNYLSTLAISKDYRRRGLAKKLYNELLKASKQENRPLVTRTWGTNESHIQLAKKLGLKEIHRLKDHRGKGIDTVYLGILLD